MAVSELDTTVTLWHTFRGLWLLSLNMLVRFINAAQHCGSLVTVAAVLEFRTLLALVYLLLLVDVWADPGRGTIEALFTIARTWKQPRGTPTDEWIKKLWYIYIMEYYKDIKRNAFESVLMRWMNIEPSVQSEVSQIEKDKYRILTHT